MTKFGVMEDTRTSVRLPPGWHDRIAALARNARRSVHAEILWLIERGLHLEETGGTSDDAADR